MTQKRRTTLNKYLLKHPTSRVQVGIVSDTDDTMYCHVLERMVGGEFYVLAEGIGYDVLSAIQSAERALIDQLG